MRMNAYDVEYLESAQNNIGHMLDFAVNTLDYELDFFFQMFIISGIARQCEKGNPTYLVGKNGCELAKEVLRQSGIGEVTEKDVLYLDKSPEYWVGWAVSFYQWYSGKSFARIQRAVPVSIICGMYGTLHGADIMKFVSIMDEKMEQFYQDTRLKYFRTITGYTQKELAERSGVSLRQIQLFEQRQRDINKAQAESVQRLAWCLGCEMEDLME